MAVQRLAKPLMPVLDVGSIPRIGIERHRLDACLSSSLDHLCSRIGGGAWLRCGYHLRHQICAELMPVLA